MFQSLPTLLVLASVRSYQCDACRLSSIMQMVSHTRFHHQCQMIKFGRVHGCQLMYEQSISSFHYRSVGPLSPVIVVGCSCMSPNLLISVILRLIPSASSSASFLSSLPSTLSGPTVNDLRRPQLRKEPGDQGID